MFQLNTLRNYSSNQNIPRSASESLVEIVIIARRKNDFEKFKNRKCQAPIWICGTSLSLGRVTNARLRLTGDSGRLNCPASGGLWGEVGGRVVIRQILQIIGVLSHPDGTDGNI